MAVLALAMVVNIGVGNVQSLLLMAGRSGLHLLATLADVMVNLTLGVAADSVARRGGRGGCLGHGNRRGERVRRARRRRVVGHPLLTRRMARVAGVVGGAVGAASALAAIIAGRSVAGLAVALGTLSLTSVSYLTIPSSRRQLWDILRKIREGRQV